MTQESSLPPTEDNSHEAHEAEERLSHRGKYSESEIERLGRQRPDVFKSLWVEIGFGFSLLGSMFVAEYFISGFNVLLPALSQSLHIPPQAETWPASVSSLVTGAFLLPVGRLADMFGGYIVFNAGLAWFVIWSIVAGFSQNYTMLIVCRALQGFGPAAFLPSGIKLLGSIVSIYSTVTPGLVFANRSSTALAPARTSSFPSTVLSPPWDFLLVFFSPASRPNS